MNGFIRLVDHTRYVLLGALLLLTPVLIDFHIIVGAGPESKFRLLEYGVLLCALLSAPVLLARRSSLRLHGQTIAIGALIFYFLLRAWLDPVREFALDVAFRPVSILLFALLVSDACRTSSALRRLIWVGVFSQLFTIAYAVGETFGVDLLFDYIMGVSWRWWNEFVSEDRGVIWNTLGNPNYYASYGAMLLINLLTLFALSRRKRHRCVLAIYLLALIYTLMYTFTRGIWVSLALTALTLSVLGAFQLIRIHGGSREIVRRYGKRLFAALALIFIMFAIIYGVESLQGRGPLHAVVKRFHYGLTFRDALLPYLAMLSSRGGIKTVSGYALHTCRTSGVSMTRP